MARGFSTARLAPVALGLSAYCMMCFVILNLPGCSANPCGNAQCEGDACATDSVDTLACADTQPSTACNTPSDNTYPIGGAPYSCKCNQILQGLERKVPNGCSCSDAPI